MSLPVVSAVMPYQELIRDSGRPVSRPEILASRSGGSPPILHGGAIASTADGVMYRVRGGNDTLGLGELRQLSEYDVLRIRCHLVA